MAGLGYFPSSEEHGPRRLLQYAQMGEEAGLTDILISDHYHPWIERQGESPFVWSVIGAIAASTNCNVTTGVTCPTVRTDYLAEPVPPLSSVTGSFDYINPGADETVPCTPGSGCAAENNAYAMIPQVVDEAARPVIDAALKNW